MAAAFECLRQDQPGDVHPPVDEGLESVDGGDDIAWIKPDASGRLRAINPEAGVFGVAPGTSRTTNPNAMDTVARKSIFTNVALTPEGGVWWEGMTEHPPAECLDWRGERWTPELGRRDGKTAAHPNARFTAPASQCPTSIPIGKRLKACRSAPSSGGRRANTMRWSISRSIGAACMSARRCVRDDRCGHRQVGALRRDPMAMLPFCGYHMGNYFRHWIQMQRSLSETPRIFHVNWFRKDAAGAFLWLGFRENMRVLKWIADRTRGQALARETPIGWMPRYQDMEWNGLEFSKEQFDELEAFDRAAWRKEVIEHEELFIDLHDHLPPEMVYGAAPYLRQLVERRCDFIRRCR
jgi:phosphoenolpyruvate carboxykinase (GTP)